MAATNELIASGRTDEEVAKEIGADWLIYQDLDDLIASTQEGNPTIKNFEMSIFDGKYPTSISSDYLEDLESSRKDDQKVAREKSN
jgi:amidophosphoribosyltransferase